MQLSHLSRSGFTQSITWDVGLWDEYAWTMGALGSLGSRVSKQQQDGTHVA